MRTCRKIDRKFRRKAENPMLFQEINAMERERCFDSTPSFVAGPFSKNVVWFTESIDYQIEDTGYIEWKMKRCRIK